MPFRKVARKLIGVGKRRFRRRTAGSIAKLSRRVNALARASAPEAKFKDVNSSSVAVSSTATITLLNGMAPGDSAITREGQTITMLYSWFQFDMIVNSSATATVCRFLIVYDMQANGAAFAASDLFVSATNLNSPFLIGYNQRFRVIWDRRYQLSTVGSNYQVIKKIFKKMNHKTQYNGGTAGTVADIATGSLYLVLISDEPTNTPTLSYYHRLRFAG